MRYSNGYIYFQAPTNMLSSLFYMSLVQLCCPTSSSCLWTVTECAACPSVAATAGELDARLWLSHRGTGGTGGTSSTSSSTSSHMWSTTGRAGEVRCVPWMPAGCDIAGGEGGLGLIGKIGGPRQNVLFAPTDHYIHEIVLFILTAIGPSQL